MLRKLNFYLFFDFQGSVLKLISWWSLVKGRECTDLMQCSQIHHEKLQSKLFSASLVLRRQSVPFLHTGCIYFMIIICIKNLMIGVSILTQTVKTTLFSRSSLNFPNFRTTDKCIIQSQLLCGMDVLSPRQQQHQKKWLTISLPASLSTQFHKQDRIMLKVTYGRVLPISRTPRWWTPLPRRGIELCHRHPKMHLEQDMFQLLYDARLSISGPKTFSASCQNFIVNSFSCVSDANLCDGRCEEFRSKHFEFWCYSFISHVY